MVALPIVSAALGSVVVPVLLAAVVVLLLVVLVGAGLLFAFFLRLHPKFVAAAAQAAAEPDMPATAEHQPNRPQPPAE